MEKIAQPVEGIKIDINFSEGKAFCNVKNYAGDSYWRECFRSFGISNEIYYATKYGKENLELIKSGKRTPMDIAEYSNKKGDYFTDKNGTIWEAQ